MKPTAGYAKPRRLTVPSTRLNLQRRPKREPEDELEERQRSSFWKWVMLVALLHVLVIGGIYIYFLFVPAPKPADHFISLLPPGDVVKGSVGAQQAHKVGANAPAAPSHHAAPPPPPAAVAPHPPQPKAPTPPVVKPPPPSPIAKTAPTPKPVKAKPTPPKPVTPPKPKVKIDLHEVERTDATEAPPKPAKHHAKKPVKNPEDSQDNADSSPDNTGLSKQQIAEKLGEKMNASGTHNALKSGVSGSPDGHENRLQAFYNLIAQQMNEVWNIPQTAADAARYPVVRIYVEKDGHVPPDRVELVGSSGIPAYDDSALAAARNLGYLREPLPDGCPSEITINCKPDR